MSWILEAKDGPRVTEQIFVKMGPSGSIEARDRVQPVEVRKGLGLRYPYRSNKARDWRAIIAYYAK